MTEMETPVYDAFVYHSRRLSGLTYPDNVLETCLMHLVASLEKVGLIVYYAERDALPGTNILEETFRVLDKSKFVICIITEDCLENHAEKNWHQMVYHRLIELHGNTGRYIPLCLGTTAERIKLKWPFLAVFEILCLPLNFLEDQSWLNKLLFHVGTSKTRRTVELNGERHQIGQSFMTYYGFNITACHCSCID